MKKTIIAAIIAMSAAVAQAGVNVQYYVGYGLYPNGAPSVTTTTPGTGLLAVNGTGNTIIQLVYAGLDGVANGGVSSLAATGDDIIWDTRTLTSGVNSDQWGYQDPLPLAYTNPTFTSGNVFVRVFQDATPAAGEYYFNSATLQLQDRQLDLSFTQTLTPDTFEAGIALNLPIVPEPSVMAFLGIGGLVLAARRRIRNA